MPRRQNSSVSRHSRHSTRLDSLDHTLPQHFDSVVDLADSDALLKQSQEGTLNDALETFCRTPLDEEWDMEPSESRKVRIFGFLISLAFDIICSPLYIWPFQDMIKISIDTGDTGKCECLVWLPNKTKMRKRAQDGTSTYGADGRARRGVVVSLHGGGWTICRPHVDYTLCRHMADELETVVIAPDYRKAPRYPYPHAIVQLRSLLCKIASGDVLSHLPPGLRPLLDCTRIALLGNSAGSNLCASLTLSTILEPLPHDAHIVSCSLLYPVLDLSIAHGDKLSMMVADKEGLPSWMSLLFLRCYIPPPRLTTDLALSPALAPNEALKRFPPTVVCSAEKDYLAKEADEFSDRLKSLGVQVEHKNFKQVGHAFDAKPELWSKTQRDLNTKARIEAWGMIKGVMLTALSEQDIDVPHEVLLHSAAETVSRDTDSASTGGKK